MFGVDEALINAYAAFANTNNPDDQVKIKNLYNSFKKGKISKSEFDKGINHYIQSNGDVGAYPAKNFDYTAGHSVDLNRDELRNAADRYENVKSVLNGRVQNAPASVPVRLIRDITGNFIPGGSSLLEAMRLANDTYAPEESFANIKDSRVSVPGKPPQYGGPFLRRPGWGLVEENPQPQAPAPAPADNKDEVAKLARGVADSIENLVKADKAQGKSEIPNSSAVSDANPAKTQANAYDPSIRLNNDVQYVINLLKTYGYSQQVLDSFKQNIDKILANTKDNNRIDTANQYIDQFLGDKQDLRRLDPVPGKPAPDQPPQAPTDVTADVMKAVKADGNTSFANWRQSLVNQGWDGDPSKIKYDPSTGKFMYNVSGQVVKSAGKPALDQQPQKAGKNNKPGKKPSMSDAEIDAFLNDELGGDTTGNGTYASAGVAKGGTKTIGYGYDPNPGNVSLAYAMRNAPEQERRDALINEWNRENGRLNRSSGTYASPGISSGGTYATGEGIKDANGNVLTNPGGNADYQYALRDPSYGLVVRDRLTDAQKDYLQAVYNNMGYNYNITGAPRYI